MLAVELLISDRSGDTSVLLDPAGDHIVIKYTTDAGGYERDVTLPVGSFAWDRAIKRARRAAAFL